MKLKPHFLFHANASAMGGRIAKPKDILIESGAASSLSAAGGRSTSRSAKGSVGRYSALIAVQIFTACLFFRKDPS